MPNIIDEIRTRPKPGDMAQWWGKQPPRSMSRPLDDEEKAYVEFFTSSELPPILRIGCGIANEGNLSPEDRERAAERFGTRPTAILEFINYENRRRIVAHYVLTHPATVQYELGLYRLTRDVFPVTFVGERIYELFTGKEALTGEKVSRLEAGVDLLIPIVLGRVLRMARGASVAARPLTRPLAEPIYDLPPEGGMTINGRWYTEHALERMAPDTPQVQAELRTRAMRRLQRLGIQPGSPPWDACVSRALQKIDPRGVPPSVVEAEIARPGSTNVTVITAQGRRVVVTVIPR